MNVGMFLLAVVLLVVALMIYEAYAWLTGKVHTISYQALHHPLLRWTIVLAIALFGAWWIWHSAQFSAG